MKKRSAGFTLVEVMIVVAVVGILAAIAYPSYRDSVLKGRRAEARAELADLLQQQERYLTQNNTYLAFAENPGVPVFKHYVGPSPAQATYLLSAVACGGGVPIRQCVQLVARPLAADPEAGSLTLQSSGLKGCDGTRPAICWR